MTRHARILLHAKVTSGSEAEFETAYRTVAERMQQAQGHIQDELIRNADGGTPSYVVMSEWESRDAFMTWFLNPRHHDTTAPMSPYWYDTEVQIFELVDRLDRYEPRDPG